MGKDKKTYCKPSVSYKKTFLVNHQNPMRKDRKTYGKLSDYPMGKDRKTNGKPSDSYEKRLEKYVKPSDSNEEKKKTISKP